jgi:hypothetical protein
MMLEVNLMLKFLLSFVMEIGSGLVHVQIALEFDCS